MTLPLRWSASARADLASLIRFIANENPHAAQRMKSLIESAVLPTTEHPYMCPAGRVPGTREMVAHPNYIVVYQVAAESVQILGVMHSRQEYP